MDEARQNHSAAAVAVFSLLAAASLQSCSTLKSIGQAVTNLASCKFKLASISDFTLGGISLQGKRRFEMADGVKLLAGFTQNSLPASFTLSVAAINPNDGTAGTMASPATLTGFAWTLLVDSTATINGDIASPIVLPASGKESIIPLKIRLDLVDFFKNKGYEHILNLALALGGMNGSPSRITLRAKPTIQTDFGAISYPGTIDIIDKEFR